MPRRTARPRCASWPLYRRDLDRYLLPPSLPGTTAARAQCALLPKRSGRRAVWAATLSALPAELAPAARGDLPVELARSLAHIDRGELADGTLAELAAEAAGISERTLRRQFEQHLGASPKQVEQTRRLLLAKRLLTETGLPITDIAFAAGFASIRRFNDAWLNAYGLAPRTLRQQEDCNETVDDSVSSRAAQP